MMEDCVNNNLEDNKKHLNEVNDIGLDDEEGGKKQRLKMKV